MRRLVIRRIILIVITLLTGLIFFSLLSGTCHIKSKTVSIWHKTDKNTSYIQLSSQSETDKETKTDETVHSDLYKNTDIKLFRFLWQEDFDGVALNIDKWSCVSKTNNDNNELQAYMPENVRVSDGVLYLTADISQKNSRKKYSSGMIETLNKDEFLYGKIEVRASIPSGKGLFPAIWMIPQTGNFYEIDILESIGSESSIIYAGNHYYLGGKRTKKFNSATINNPQDFHIYSVEWMPDRIVWYVDNKIFHQTSTGVADEKMYLILNLAVGGNWPGSPDSMTVFPNSFKVDYIRVYEYIGGK